MGVAMVCLLGVLVWGSFSGLFDRYFSPLPTNAVALREALRAASLEDLAVPSHVRDLQIGRLIDELTSSRH